MSQFLVQKICYLVSDLEIPLSDDNQEDITKIGEIPGGSGGGGSGGSESGVGGESGSSRAPSLRLALSAGGVSVPLDRPGWTLYRAVLTLHARMPHTDMHRDTTYT